MMSRTRVNIKRSITGIYAQDFQCNLFYYLLIVVCLEMVEAANLRPPLPFVTPPSEEGRSREIRLLFKKEPYE